MGTCTGFTFGSVVSNDLIGLSWNALGDALIIAEFSIVALVFLLNCFADESPLYQDLKCELRVQCGPLTSFCYTIDLQCTYSACEVHI